MAKNALRVGKPVDLGADVPIFPPFALLFCFAASLAMWRMTGKRLRWLSWPVDSKWVRVAAFVGAVSVAVSVVDAAGKALRDAGSGINFVDVEGLATTFPFDATRNPMYACLLFVVTPALAVLVDSAWPLVFLPLLYAYISDIVIPAEENQLLSAFGKKYAEYAAATPRLSAMGLANGGARESGAARNVRRRRLSRKAQRISEPRRRPRRAIQLPGLESRIQEQRGGEKNEDQCAKSKCARASE